VGFDPDRLPLSHKLLTIKLLFVNIRVGWSWSSCPHRRLSQEAEGLHSYFNVEVRSLSQGAHDHQPDRKSR